MKFVITRSKIWLKKWKKHELLEVNAKTNLKQLIFGELKNPERTLLFASNGRVLMELLTILIENKIDIPQQIGITGFDDWHLTALVGPGITSIEQQSQQIGEVAAEKLMNFLKNAEELEQEIIVPAKVQWRKSI